jgi:predicted branched-subunit amino acid permease
VRYVRAFIAFWWDFVVGDDWRVAVGVALGLGLAAFLAHRGFAAWWVLPATVAVVLAASLRRATRSRGKDDSG